MSFLFYLSDHLFEVGVEVNFQPNPGELWDSTARALQHSVQTSVRYNKDSYLGYTKKVCVYSTNPLDSLN